MGIRPAITSIPTAGDIQNMPRIYTAAHCCILLDTLKGYNKGTLL